MKKDFGGFELYERIGSGGMASVYRGVQKSLDRKVVLKVLHPHLAEDNKLIQRFEREARAAANLRHPNIVQVIDCGKWDESSYIAMEYVEGMDLKKWLEAYGPPPLEITLLLLRDLAGGLAHAHQHRIVHRDIKPANVMLTPDGTLKIMDFGLARREEDSTSVTVTVAGSVLGTPAYMSPEQATGGVVDERSDIFSAGVVGYELLGAARPFQGDTYSSVLHAILTAPAPPLDELNPLVPSDVVGIVSKMLQKDVSKRYQRIAMVRSDLENVIEGMGLLRAQELLREYAQDPNAMAETLRRKRLSRHLDQGLFYETLGLGKIDDAVLEFQRVLHLDSGNKVAREHLQKLEKERKRMRDESGVALATPPPDATLVMPPGAIPAPTAVSGPASGAGSGPASTPAPSGRIAERPRPPARERGPIGRRVGRAAASQTQGLLIGASILLVVAIIAILWVMRGGTGARGDRRPEVVAKTEEAKPPAEPKTKEATPPPKPPAAPSGSSVVASALASLDIRSKPTGAKISVDGEAQRQSSNATLERMAAGEHVIRLEKRGYLPLEERVNLSSGETGRINAVLKPDPKALGAVTLRVTPYATYFVDGKQQGQPNTVTQALRLAPGTHVIRAVHPKFEPKTWNNVKVEPNGAIKIAYDFERGSVGGLRVTSPGAWAYVVLNGKNTGKTTPAVFEDLKPGRYQVFLMRDGFVAEGGTKTVTVEESKVASVAFSLRSQP